MTPSGLERFKWFYHKTPTSKANRNYWLLQGPHDSGSFPPPLLCPFVFSVLPRVKDIIFLWKLSDRWAVLWVTSISHITVLNCDSLLFSITHTRMHTHTGAILTHHSVSVVIHHQGSRYYITMHYISLTWSYKGLFGAKTWHNFWASLNKLVALLQYKTLWCKYFDE